jgi:hypothetical protein
MDRLELRRTSDADVAAARERWADGTPSDMIDGEIPDADPREAVI